jgi:hypothetical protein
MKQRIAVRHKLQVPTHTNITLNNGDVRSYEWKTRDVSSCGAFLLTNFFRWSYACGNEVVEQVEESIALKDLEGLKKFESIQEYERSI